jgi:hypothetical protein
MPSWRWQAAVRRSLISDGIAFGKCTRDYPDKQVLFKVMKIKMIMAVVISASISAFIAKGQDAQDKALISAMASVVEAANVALPLARQEFPVLETKFKGMNTLLNRIDTPLKLAEGLADQKNLQSFNDRVIAKDVAWGDAVVLDTIDQLRGVDAALLAEAVAGSSRAAELIAAYLMEEAAIFRLVITHQDWSGRIAR